MGYNKVNMNLNFFKKHPPKDSALRQTSKIVLILMLLVFLVGCVNGQNVKDNEDCQDKEKDWMADYDYSELEKNITIMHEVLKKQYANQANVAEYKIFQEIGYPEDDMAIVLFGLKGNKQPHGIFGIYEEKLAGYDALDNSHDFFITNIIQKQETIFSYDITKYKKNKCIETKTLTLMNEEMKEVMIRSRDIGRSAHINIIQFWLKEYYHDQKFYPKDIYPSIEYNGKVYLDQTPKNPVLEFGDCPNKTDKYIYKQLNGGSSYSITFCLNTKLGNYHIGTNTVGP